MPGTNPGLIKTCFDYGLLYTIYTNDGKELVGLPELSTAFRSFQKATKGKLYFLRIYQAPAEILYDEIKKPITVVKLGLTQQVLLPEEVIVQDEIPETEIPAFFAEKRIKNIEGIIDELIKMYAQSYQNQFHVWKYSSRDHTLIYSNSKIRKEADTEEIRKWIITFMKPDDEPATRAIRKGFLSPQLLVKYCKRIGQLYPDHACSKCKGNNSEVPDVSIE
jgi:hypothetical protein